MAEYSRHAEEKMEGRGVAKADVETALRRPIGDPEPGQPGTIWIRGHAPGGRILKVCVRVAEQDFVITAAWPGHDDDGS